ncbi:unnamed protein product [Thelazia callipaeda]|uniref:Activin_recp domain-containing protein n=1 Tax=Thelazia callipaeda TaxID=103827 RepID=A0A0N5D9J9_THECL|nr:unnamed protein product [Thelazia callipaeda]
MVSLTKTFWLIFFLEYVSVLTDLPEPFITTSLICSTYQKINGRETKRHMDDCMFGNTCCYSTEYINTKTKREVESGGCEDEYRFMIGTHPIFGSLLPVTTSYICEAGTCIEQTTSDGVARLCACNENNCNEKGINDVIRNYRERVRKGLVKRPPDYGKILEQTMQILLDG